MVTEEIDKIEKFILDNIDKLTYYVENFRDFKTKNEVIQKKNKSIQLEINNIKKLLLSSQNIMFKFTWDIINEQLLKHHLGGEYLGKYKKGEYYLKGIFFYLFQFFMWARLNDAITVKQNEEKIFKAAIYGVLGYRILDFHIDENNIDEIELIFGLSLISLQEDLLLDVFGHSKVNNSIISNIKNKLFKTEIKEKKCKFNSLIYNLEKPVECADKAIHLFTPFALSLNSLGKYKETYKYLEIFNLTFAPMQILDDIFDVNEDVKVGHYALPVNKYFSKKDLSGNIRDQIIKDKEWISILLKKCTDMFDSADILSKDIENDTIFIFNMLASRLKMNMIFNKLLYNDE